ncbi:MAG: fibronectin type III domain-containing protein [Planctomycetota bacterium]
MNRSDRLANFAFAFVCMSLVIDRAVAEELMVPVTSDNSIVMVDSEWQVNGGSQGRIRIKGNQHVVVMSFDLKSIKGRLVKKATLICEQGEQAISGVTISTIATPWDENASNALTCGVEGIVDWGYPGAQFPAICGGNSGTLVTHQLSELKDGKYFWSVPPDMIHAMSIGVAHGLAIHEHEADYGRNPTICSREQSSRKPYLLVELDDPGNRDVKPEPPTDLILVAVDSQTAELHFLPPARGFAYEIFVDDHPLGRHNIPMFSESASRGDLLQTSTIRDLPDTICRPGDHTIRVRCVNRQGETSPEAVIRGELFRAAEIPIVDVRPPAPKTAIEGVAIIPPTDKYDEAGNPVGSLRRDYRSNNSIFDGSMIRLVAAAGEVVGFQALLRGSGDVSVELHFDGSLKTELWQAVYVPSEGHQIPDPLLPLSKMVSLQRDTDTCVVGDVFVSFEEKAGKRRGELRISDGRNVPIELTVLPFALPKHATFVCEMNGYGLPEHVDDYYELQQVAYDHRVHSNILHYSHNTAAKGARKSNLDMRLRSGRRMDNRRYDDIAPGSRSAYWDDFAEAFGPVLDGSLFASGHRGPIPVPAFYLTFHESWPLNCRPYFNGNPDAYRSFESSPEYAETFVSILQDFVRLAEQKRWRQTGFQVYFNNKGSMKELTKAPWILDEPSAFWDFRALQFYGELTDRGRTTAESVRVDYRVDISRPEYCRGQLKGRSDLWVVSSAAFENHRRLVTDRIRADGLKAWVYGTSNHVHESNRNIMAWALDARRSGAMGIVPWQTVNKDGSALNQADQLGLFIFDRDAKGNVVVRHSLRLKAYRDAQQLIEYLNLLQVKLRWNDQQLRDFIQVSVPLAVSVEKKHAEDAGTSTYTQISPDDFDHLRRRASHLLSLR